MVVILLLVVLLILIFLIRSVVKPNNFPPGPFWLPIVGNLPRIKQLSRKLGGEHLALIELAKEYKTGTLGLKYGKNIVVIAVAPKTIKDVLTSEEYEGRPNDFFFKLRCFGERRGITSTDGKLWAVQRQFVVRHLRNLGFGKKETQVKIKEELCNILDAISHNRENINISRVLSQAVLNVIWFLITGKRINRNDSRFHKLLDLLGKRSGALEISGGILNHFPWLRFIAPEKTNYNLIKQLNKELKEFLMEIINEHHSNWFEGRNDDLIYSFITEMKQQANGISGMFTDAQLLMICVDLFVAGSHTTSSTINFAVLMMLLHPDKQTKIQEYLDQLFYEKKEIDYTDKYKVPYIEAVLSEIQRYYSVTAIIGPRRTLRDTILDGYSIPKDTTVLIHPYALHMNKEIWGDPEAFRPERFLDSKGKYVLNDNLIPFGLGRRRCLGESLARNCIFLIFSEIIRNYNVRPVKGLPLPTGKPQPGLTLSPEKYFAQFVSRSDH